MLNDYAAELGWLFEAGPGAGPEAHTGLVTSTVRILL
jgi:hypothetical protein